MVVIEQCEIDGDDSLEGWLNADPCLSAEVHA